MTPLIEAKALSISIRQIAGTVRVVEDVSFHIYPAEVFCLVGESGCGKTLTALSVLRVLPEHIHPDGEVILYRNSQKLDLLSLPEETLRTIRGKDIAMVFQEPMTSLNPVLTIKDQIIEPLLVHERLTRTEAIDRAVELLLRTGFKDPQRVLRSYPHQLSGGMRQRIMLCMAIICNPRLLIADEPTTALDVTIQAEIMNLLQEIQSEQSLAVLLITHNLALVREVGHRVAIMYAGSIVEEAPVEELFQNPLHPYTKGLLESIPTDRTRPLKPIPGSVPPPGQWPPGCRFEPRCTFKKDICAQRLPMLEEVSKDHMVRCHLWRQI